MFRRSILAFCVLIVACDSPSSTNGPPGDMSGVPDMAVPLGVVKDGVASGTDIQILYTTSAGGLRSPRGLFDVKASRECQRAVLSDAHYHCVPVERVQPTIYFTDSACGSRIYSSEIECGGQKFIEEALGCGLRDLYQAEIFVAGPPTYYVMNGMCLRANLTPELLASALYVRGVKLPPSLFPVLLEARGGG